jgi:hypothetical protein
MDITPSVPDVQHASGGILVPDRELQDWKESHPKGYAGWFEKIAAREPATLAVEARADVERLPAELPFKGSLRRIVQIMKRHRDVWRAKQPVEQRDDAPISIIITTLAAKAYEKALKGFYLNALDLLLDVTDTMPSFIEVQWNESGMPDLWVRNPCNDKENFADKWHANPQRAEAFHNWHNAFKSDLDKLAQEPGIDAVARGLGELMDESVSKSVMAEHMKRMNAKRASLGVSASASGLLITPSGAAKAVPLNTFYGR